MYNFMKQVSLAYELPLQPLDGVGFSLSRGHSLRPSKGGDRENAPLSRRSAPASYIKSTERIRIGVCAVDKKARAKPMLEIISRLEAYGDFEVCIFGDECILNKPVDQWPTCDVLLSWYSEGFPLKKAQQYVARMRPTFVLNDLKMQEILLDRRKVYKLLQENRIPVPEYIVVDRDGGSAIDPFGFTEGEDYVEMDGHRIQKPFVEKPVSSEDHNINIYYPHSQGGGVKRLFRKVDDKSGDYDPNHPGTVRRDGSYIYEKFLPTGGTDVKVYTVGSRYAHAEARKSPVVDGKVLRTSDGKEIRFPVLLTPQEKEVARMVSNAFGQRVCGFDLLRAEDGTSFVCDVNGWSFVKNSRKYYDDAAGIIRSLILGPNSMKMPASPPFLRQHDPGEDESTLTSVASQSSLQECGSIDSGMLAGPGSQSPDSQLEELRCVLAVIRHGDRTPKQKMKMRVSHPAFWDLFRKHCDAKGKQAKLKSPGQLQELLELTRGLLETHDRRKMGQGDTEPDDLLSQEEVREKLRILKTVLEQGGTFSGVNRKVQLKPLLPLSATSDDDLCWYQHSQDLVLILKYGGVLTHAGRQQAEDLGKTFRTSMYPRLGNTKGGLLRLHSTYRHDFKIYSSDEGRVQTSAAAFTQGLLDLEGTALTPILVSLVKFNASMLEAFGKGASDDIRRVKGLLYDQMTWDPLQGRSLSAQQAMPTSNSMPSFTPPLSPPTAFNHMMEQKSSSMPQIGILAKAESSLTEQLVRNGVLKGNSTDSEEEPPHISNMPLEPLKLLRKLVNLMKVLVDTLRLKCFEGDKPDDQPNSYCTLQQDPRTAWTLHPSKPCAGERFLLLFDRWRKLLRSFYNEQKGLFDISKVPDIYDSAKYDGLHNAHLGLDLRELYDVSRILAAAVVPNEYGLDSGTRLQIGSKICQDLLGKLLSDMGAMQTQSIMAGGWSDAEAVTEEDDMFDGDLACRPPADVVRSVGSYAPSGIFDSRCEGEDAIDADILLDDDIEPHQGDAGALHRLHPNAPNVSSPLRHVRTRVYFTSESHIHSLVNVLRYSHTKYGGSIQQPLLSQEGLDLLDACAEFDYLTHIAFRMFENKMVPVSLPERFRVEILFSPGAHHNLFNGTPGQGHVLPPQPLIPIHAGNGVSFDRINKILSEFATPHTIVPPLSFLYADNSGDCLKV